MRRMNRRGRRKDRFAEDGDINPMNYAANMSDAMLILAVGIMLALIVHFNVDVSTTGGDGQSQGMTLYAGQEEIDTDEAVEFTEDNLTEVESPEGDSEEGTGIDRLGDVYYDSGTGKYYIVKDDTE